MVSFCLCIFHIVSFVLILSGEFCKIKNEGLVNLRTIDEIRKWHKLVLIVSMWLCRLHFIFNLLCFKAFIVQLLIRVIVSVAQLVIRNVEIFQRIQIVKTNVLLDVSVLKVMY